VGKEVSEEWMRDSKREEGKEARERQGKDAKERGRERKQS
jgi:hypothetical protein